MADLNPGPARREPKRPSKKKLSPALARIAKRALKATEDDIRSYAPREVDIQIAEAMLAGSVMFQDIAEEVGCAPSTISKLLSDPVVCAWISRRVHENIGHRLGLVDAAMFNSALHGNVPAAKLMYERYDKTGSGGRITVNAPGAQINFDPSKLTDEELDAELNIIDVPFEPKKAAPDEST